MTFAADLRQFAAKTNARAETVVRKVVLDIGHRLDMRSPVGDPTRWSSPPPPGYAGGRFRANWRYGFGAQPVGDLPDIDPSGVKAQAALLAGVMASPALGVHFIVNNLPYAQALEDGHSGQAPQGMVGLTVVEYQGAVDKVARS